MKNIFWKTKLFTSLAFLFLLTAVHAAKPMWTFTPLTSTSVAVSPTGTATVQYMVTNQSKKARTLEVRQTLGIHQLEPCVLAPAGLPGSSCTLTLGVTGKFVPPVGISGGPILCQISGLNKANPNQCYQPSADNVLNVTRFLQANEVTLGGTISGLAGTVVLQINGANQEGFSNNGPFTFSTTIATGSSYLVTVNTQPAGEICTVENGFGVAGTSPITNIIVVCSSAANAHTVGGTVSGLAAGTVTLINNGDDAITVGNGSYTFPMPVAQGATYFVQVVSNTEGKICTAEESVGTMDGANVTNVDVICSTTGFRVGGTVSGLSGASPVVLMNWTESLTVNANGAFQFPTPIATGARYNVVVATQPADRTCVVTNGAGTMDGGDVNNVVVECFSDITTLVINNPRLVLPIGEGNVVAFSIANSGAVDALNVNVIHPEGDGWNSLIIDRVGCDIVHPGQTCFIRFISAPPFIPFVAGPVTAVATNVRNNPVAFLASSLNGNLVFGADPINSTASTKIWWAIEPADRGTFVWSDPPFGIGNCANNGINDLSLTSNTAPVCGSQNNQCNGALDGACNTPVIVSRFAAQNPAAANACNSRGLFLPAICQLSVDSSASITHPCHADDDPAFFASVGVPNINSFPNIYTNLFQYGFGFPEPRNHWSSTAWFDSNSGAWFESILERYQDVNFKNETYFVRCASATPINQ